MERKRDGAIPRGSYVMTADPYFFAGRYEECIDLGTQEVETRTALVNNPLTEGRLVRMLCAIQLDQMSVLEEDLEYFHNQLNQAENLATTHDLKEEQVRQAIQQRIDATQVEQLIDKEGIANVRARLDFNDYLTGPVLSDYDRYFILRLGSTAEVFETLGRFADADGGRSTNRVALRGMVEQLRPELLLDERYLALLEHYDVTDAWRDEFCQRAAKLQRRTGVEVTCSAVNKS